MGVDLAATYTITAPSGVDGFGEVAVLNDTTSPNFIGYLADLSWGREVRQDADNIPSGSGGIHGSFRSGRLPFTMEIILARASTGALSNARDEKLKAALNAMESDGTIVWTESGRVATRILFRQQNSPNGPDKDAKVIFNGVSADPLILANTASTGSPGSGLTNGGKAATFPTFTFTSGASGQVVLSRTSPSPTQTVTLNIGGVNGIAASTSTTVDFAAKTIMQGSTHFDGALVFPASVWWKMAPGANTISVTGASGVTISWRSAWLP